MADARRQTSPPPGHVGLDWLVRAKGAVRNRVAPIVVLVTLLIGTLWAGILWFGVLWFGVEMGVALVPLGYQAIVTPRLCMVDIAEHRLPDRLVLPCYTIALLASLASWIVSGRFTLLPLVASAGYLLFLLIFGLAGGVGMGDVKLAGVLGLVLGLVGATEALLGPLLGFLLGGVGSVVLLVAGKANRHSRIPFGPFMLAGFWLAVPSGLLL